MHDLPRWRLVRHAGFLFSRAAVAGALCRQHLTTLSNRIVSFLWLSGSSLLRAKVALEELGSGQDHCAQDGPRPWDNFGGRAKAKEEDAH